MSTSTAPAGAGRRTRELRRLVGGLVLLAVVLQVLVGAVVGDVGAVAPLPEATRPDWLTSGVLLALLLGLCVAADVYAVRIRHGEEAEELTLTEAAAVVCVLLLPPVQALLLPVAASIACSLVRRRPPVKMVFNAANVGLGSAVLLGGAHAVSGAGAGVTPATTAGLVLGMTAYTAANLIAVARVIAIMSGDDPAQAVRDGLRLSAVMALGTIGLGATAVTLASAAPALLPFSVLPAAALTFAYRAVAQEAEERRRSSGFLALSQLLAERLEADEMVDAFVRLARQAFRTDVGTAVLLFDDGSTHCSSDDRVLGVGRGTAGDRERALLALAGSGPSVVGESLEHGWTSALVVPLEADGRRLGVVALGARDRHRRLGRSELSLFVPLVAALAVALMGTDNLRRLVEETSKLQAVVDRSSDGIVVLDDQGVVQLWSPAASALTGLSYFDAIGLPLGEILAARTAEGRPVDAFAEGRRLLSPALPETVVELVLDRSDGEARVVRCAHAGVFDASGALERDVVLLHDVTRERQVERLKADFIATVSHELRTPVTPIKGYADLLRRRGEAMTPERRNECLEVISDRAAHLARLVEDLLLASRISVTEGASAASVTLGRHDLVALVRRACADFGDDGERIALHLPAHEVPVGCDPMRTVQVLGNLVGNALKYSAPGTPVDVRLAALGNGVGDRVRVDVVDRGRGIPADQLDKVFDKFHRVEDPMRMTTGGTGLGLYIAKQLTEAMGGALTCTSVLGTGSTFALTLAPAGTEEPAAGPFPVGGAAVEQVPRGTGVLPLPRPRPLAARGGPRLAAAPHAPERGSAALG
ncbi:MAG TPA: ATP-binding protein [Mycobacteriales bacterium]|nr:ATP-binding protein [Mycobacteriales bacterium]